MSPRHRENPLCEPWPIFDDGDGDAFVGERQDGPPTSDEMEAAIRYVAKHRPRLAVALVWAICQSPDLAEEMTRVDVAPTDLAELYAIDPALAAIVRASPEALARRARAWGGGGDG